jgi:signal transduction histidine kinase
VPPRTAGVPPARRDFLLIVLILIVIDAAAAILLIYVYYPRRREEALARARGQLALLARDRQNEIEGWVAERLADVELTASLLGANGIDARAPELLDHYLRAYRYESAIILNDDGTVVFRRGRDATDLATIAEFVRQAPPTSRSWIDFRRTAKGEPKILSVCRMTQSGRGTVVFVSNPYDYVYPLFNTVTVASRTGETVLIGLYGDWGVALSPYRFGSAPPMTVRAKIPAGLAAEQLARGEQSIRMVDRRGIPIIGVVKAIPRTLWVVFAKIDEVEAVEGAVDESVRLGEMFAFGSLMVATTAFVILRSRRVFRMRQAEEAVRHLSARVLRVQDETQRRIARELHETVAQSLAGLRMNLAMMQRTEMVAESLEIVDSSMNEVRTMSYLLHPPMIDQAGLITALRWYLEGFQQRSGIATTLIAPDDLGRLARSLETTVFRIVQESLTNVQRHSGSAIARVAVQRDGDRLSIEIADEGRGLPPALRDNQSALLASGVGIAGINERVHELRGEMNIRSSESGTTLTVTLPIDRHHSDKTLITTVR